MPWLYTGRVIREGRAWSDADGIQHPSNWATWSTEEKTARGLVWQDPPAPYDNRFYWSADNPKSLEDVDAVDENDDPILDENGVQVVTKGLKSVHIERSKNIANSLLQSTDWYIIRDMERSIDVPTNVASFRTAVLTHLQDLETAINAATDIDEFIALYTNVSDEDGNVTVAIGNDWPRLEDF